MDLITAQYTIPAFRYPGLLVAIVKLNRRARRLGIPAITVKITGNVTINKGTDKEPKPVLHNEIEITGIRPQLAGWEFAATLEHDYETGLTILRTSEAFKAAPIPVGYRKATALCDHCKAARNRKDTFLCYSATEGFKQIGRNCLVDFLGGKDPHAIAGAAEIWFDLQDLINSDEGSEEGWRGGGREMVIDLEEFLQRAFAVVRVVGFLGRAKARELQSTLLPTADRVLNILLPTPEQRYEATWREEAAATEPTPLDIERVTAALGWIRAEVKLKVDDATASDYEHNLFVACAGDILPLRRAGIVASLPAAYLKHIDRQEELRKQRETRKPSEFVGQIGERIEITAKLTKVIAVESEQWGTSFLHKFEEESGNRYAWFSSAGSWDEGQVYTFVGTVKDHKEDEKWGKETQLSRCREGKAKPAPKARKRGVAVC